MINIFLAIVAITAVLIMLLTGWQNRDQDVRARKQIRHQRMRHRRSDRTPVLTNAYGEVYFAVSGIADGSPLIRSPKSEFVIDRYSVEQPLLLTCRMDEEALLQRSRRPALPRPADEKENDFFRVGIA
jgi:FtsZ-interacting cell division protein ZipA